MSTIVTILCSDHFVQLAVNDCHQIVGVSIFEEHFSFTNLPAMQSSTLKDSLTHPLARFHLISEAINYQLVPV